MIQSVEAQQFRLVRRPEGMPERDDFELTTETLPAPGEGEVTVAVEYISLDPAMRGWMAEGKSYIEPVELGAVMRAFAAGTVVASRHADFAEGDQVTGLMGVATHAVMPGKQLNKVDTSQVDLPTYIGALGMPGMTAWFGIREVGELAEGDRVLVSAASGAVGALVGQIAKKQGAYVVGIAGGPEKCAYVTDELGFDGAIDYKAQDVRAAIAKLMPEGLDIFFDNVGGPILDAALGHLRVGARVVICGAISQYNQTNGVGGVVDAPANYLSLLVNRAKMEGFIILDYIHRYHEAYPQMAEWIVSGDLAHREDIDEGFEGFVTTLRKLYTGENFGKLVLKV